MLSEKFVVLAQTISFREIKLQISTQVFVLFILFVVVVVVVVVLNL